MAYEELVRPLYGPYFGGVPMEWVPEAVAALPPIVTRQAMRYRATKDPVPLSKPVKYYLRGIAATCADARPAMSQCQSKPGGVVLEAATLDGTTFYGIYTT